MIVPIKCYVDYLLRRLIKKHTITRKKVVKNLFGNCYRKCIVILSFSIVKRNFYVLNIKKIFASLCWNKWKKRNNVITVAHFDGR